jgi:GT2 family glycosyltransferase
MLSVIIGAVGQVDRTRRCVASVRACSTLPVEIVLVDNGSTDAERAGLAGLGADVLLSYPAMLGYPAAMNAGVRAASGEFVCLLNNDTEIVQPGWDARLVSVLERVQGCEIVAPAVSYSCHPNQERPAGPAQIDAEYALIETSDVPFVCAVMRRARYVALGGLDERFGLGNFEDVDMCWRVRADGGRVVIDPAVWLRHDGHATMGRLPDFVGLLDENRQRFEDKWQLEAA